MATHRWLKISSVLSLSAAGLLLWIALDHNPQGEFSDPQTGMIDLGHVLVVFCWFFVFAFTTLVVPVYAIIGLNRLIAVAADNE